MGKEERVQFLIRFGYDGARFYGLAPQPDKPTAASALRRRLESAAGGLQVRGLAFAARTDRGVHALANYATCYFTEDVFQQESIVETLVQETALERNDGLFDVAVRRVPWNIHARALSAGKHYRYRMSGGNTEELIDRVIAADLRPFGTRPDIPDELLDVWQIGPPLDVRRMQHAARYLVGTHDFSSFRGGPPDGRPPVRTITDIFVTDHGDEIVVDVFGLGFLRKMVRIIAGTLAEVGIGMRHPDTMPQVLSSRHRKAAGLTAPARGLTLVSIDTAEQWFDNDPS